MFHKSLISHYQYLEEHHPSVLGRFYALLNAFTKPLVSTFIKKANCLNEIEMNYLRSVIAFLFFYTTFVQNRGDICPKNDPEKKNILLIRALIAALGGNLMSYAAKILDVQLLIVIFALNTPLTVFFERIFFGKEMSLSICFSSILNLIGVIISVNPAILVYGLSAFPKGKFNFLLTKIDVSLIGCFLVLFCAGIKAIVRLVIAKKGKRNNF